MRRRRRNFRDVGLLVGGGLVLLVGLGLLVGGGFVGDGLLADGGRLVDGIAGFLIVGLLVVCLVGVPSRRTYVKTQLPGCTVSFLAPPRSLRWVGCLLPGGEGAAWLAELRSCLAEAQDQSERRRYIRSYRRTVPQLVWTSWAVRLSGSRRELL